jgi:phosphoglucosamine mutase
MPRLFGTDGLRGKAGLFPLNEKTIFILGQALGNLLTRKSLPLRLIIGKDTRESGNWIEECLYSGFSLVGGEAISAGIITTPGLSYLVRLNGFSAGVMISASHNPYEDNGIKIFSHQGLKIPEDWEEELEKELLAGDFSRVVAERLSPPQEPDLGRSYLEFLKQTVGLNPRKKLKLVVDCANGASYELAPELFKSLGYEVLPINNTPDGKNINFGCGSLFPEKLAEVVVREKADLGIAYDGDADRALWVDEQGTILNGDHTLFVQALHLKEKRRLNDNTVVATIMSNMGLEKALDSKGIKLLRTKVGDKYVLDEMMKRNLNLGGEQSGHTIFLDHSVAGDGLLTSLKMLEVISERDQKLSELVRDFVEYPQVLLNVRVREKVPLNEIPGYQEQAQEIKAELGQEGRLEVRYSGTEMLARIMLEGPNLEQIESLARKLAAIIEEHCGAK